MNDKIILSMSVDPDFSDPTAIVYIILYYIILYYIILYCIILYYIILYYIILYIYFGKDTAITRQRIQDSLTH